MSYENAPATVLLATHCAACGRPLVDARSVESGMGPDCRRKHGYDIEADPAARDEANRLVHAVAMARSHNERGLAEVVSGAVSRLRELGFTVLADVLAARAGIVRIVEDDGKLAVFTPFNPAATDDWRRVPGRRWDKAQKANVIPATPAARQALWVVLKRHFAGAYAVGPRGAFQVA